MATMNSVTTSADHHHAHPENAASVVISRCDCQDFLAEMGNLVGWVESIADDHELRLAQ